MRASRVNVLTAWAKMGFTEVRTQSKTYCDADRFVVQPQATAGDWQCMQPVAAVWRRYGEQPGFVSRVEGGRLQGCNIGEYSWPVPCVLTVGGFIYLYVFLLLHFLFFLLYHFYQISTFFPILLMPYFTNI